MMYVCICMQYCGILRGAAVGEARIQRRVERQGARPPADLLLPAEAPHLRGMHTYIYY